MKNSALFLLDPSDINEEHVPKLAKMAESFEYAIFLLSKADELNGHKTTGQRLIYLRKLLLRYSLVPFYLLPLATKAKTGLQYWFHLALITPPFTTLYSKDKNDETAVKMILKREFRLMPKPDTTVASDFPEDLVTKRGLYITRAQPFHYGHAAFIKQMADECDEFIVLLAAAEQSHLPHNPLSASERLEMLQEYLQTQYPGKYFLMALPQNVFTLENMLELKFLLPDFHAVYATNPIIISMCNSLKIPVEVLHRKVPVSGTTIRKKILNGEAFEELVPASTHHYLSEIGFIERLQLLNQQDKR